MYLAADPRHAGGMIDAAIRLHLTQVICQRFPPGQERDAWLRWLDDP